MKIVLRSCQVDIHVSLSWRKVINSFVYVDISVLPCACKAANVWYL
jgi:hypothetical protein